MGFALRKSAPADVDFGLLFAGTFGRNRLITQIEGHSKVLLFKCSGPKKGSLICIRSREKVDGFDKAGFASPIAGLLALAPISFCATSTFQADLNSSALNEARLLKMF